MVKTRSQADKTEVEVTFKEATTSNNRSKRTVEDITETIAALSFSSTTITTKRSSSISITPTNGKKVNEPFLSPLDIVLPASALPPPPEEEEIFDPITSVEDFNALIESTPVEQWKKRTAALVSLVATVTQKEQQQPLAIIAPAVAQLLKDLRSSVVKRTCVALKTLFSYSIKIDNTNYRQLLVALFPIVLDIAALTSTVIRQQVQDMAVHALKQLSCPDVVPIIRQRLSDPKASKNKTVREASVLYLTILLKHPNDTDNAILLLPAVGNRLILCLQDSAPSVRYQARQGLQGLRERHATVWEELVTSNNFRRDPKIQSLLSKSLQEPNESLDKLSTVKSSFRSVKPNPGRCRGGPPSAFAKFRQQQEHVKKTTSKTVGVDENTAQNNGIASGDVLVL